ncbi:hypothetical protein HPP92_018044 [Vanilla planifolia]|uniref:Uncharacterized protein n=1 Tax=Vanilla planifolia TaxID=51239 RepID=A0A835UR55_VANPL|nr:hypothetical protein HPP92_018044 [Vanilla planifolia]
MDTPERSKPGVTPISKFEDSPVFNFINSLSPIKPVKSVQSIQAFHSPCFAAISPVFASPHVGSCKESRFLVRQTFPVSVNQDTISDDINESILPAEVQSGVSPTTIALAQENSNISCSLNEATIDPADESSTRPNLSPPKQFGNCTPNHSTSACYGDSLDFKLDNSCSSLELVRFVGDGLDNADNSLSTDGNVMFIENKTKGGISGSDWENFVSVDADDVLLVDSVIGSGASKIQEDGISVGDETKMECTHQVPSSAFQDEVILNEQDQRTENGVNGLSPGCKAEFQQNRGVRRRCLIFEVAAISKINQKKSSEFPSPYFLAKSTSDDQQKVSSKTSKVQVPCILPGIGLHLNALASSSLDKVISEKSRVPGIEISSRPSISKFYSENPGEKHSEIPVALQQHQVRTKENSELPF